MYYIYIYLDPLKPGNYNYENLSFNYEPFYVGRGKNYRFKIHIQNHNLKNKSLKNSKILEIKNNGLEPIIDLYLTGLTFNDSLKIEREFISKIGRQIKNEGPLTNLTTGGQGVAGLKLSKDSIEKMKKTCIEKGIYEKFSKNMTGELNTMSGDKWHRTEEGKLSFKNKMSIISSTPQKEETIKKIKNTLKDYKWSDEEKEKRKLGMKKVWEERRKNNVTLKKIKVIATNLIDNEEIIFQTKSECYKHFNITKSTFDWHIKYNKPINNHKLKLE